MALGMAVTALAPEWWVVAIGLAVSGLGFGLFVPQAQEKVATLNDPIFRGLTVLTWVTFVRFAQVVGPPAGSWSAENLGPRITFAIAGFVMLFAALFWKPIRRYASTRASGVVNA
jgi:predicted MFS family arabinose efflux permease